jgi:hypothetical protein
MSHLVNLFHSSAIFVIPASRNAGLCVANHNTKSSNHLTLVNFLIAFLNSCSVIHHLFKASLKVIDVDLAQASK